jgi:hypothetical protein
MLNPSCNVTLDICGPPDGHIGTYATNATRTGWRFLFTRWSLASQHRKSGGFVHRSDRKLPGWLFPFEGRSLAVARAGRLVWFWLAGIRQAAGTSLALIT